jgi:hypothetical protein
MRTGAFVAGIVLCSAVACSSEKSPTEPTTTSTLTVMLTDTPFADAGAMLVTFSEVSAHRSGGAFLPLTFAGGASSRTCDLKRLVGAQDVLGTGPLPAGHYTEVRLTVASAAVYFDAATTGDACGPSLAAPAGRSALVTVPSGEIKLNREFDLTAGGTTTMTLDFNGDQSLVLAGAQYILTPVITVVSVQ